MIKLPTLTSANIHKIVRAVAYSFISASLAALMLSSEPLDKKALAAAVVAGINGALVTLKQLYNES